MKLTRKRLKELLTYDPATGVFRWRVNRGGNRAVVGKIAGCIAPIGYRLIGVDSRRYYASHLAWLYMTGRWPKNEIDHANQDQSDDRFKNLRQATRGENCHNMRGYRNKRSGLPKGVSRNGSRWYKAEIWLDCKRHYLGGFKTVELAAAAYARAAKKLHGKFARTN